MRLTGTGAILELSMCLDAFCTNGKLGHAPACSISVSNSDNLGGQSSVQT